LLHITLNRTPVLEKIAKIATHISTDIMALLPILCYPDPKLHTKAKPVEDFGARLRTLIDDMLVTMYSAKGVGLAATQVNVHEQLIVIDVSERRNNPLVLINPRQVWISDDTQFSEEGCLSVPGIYDQVQRHTCVKVEVQDTQERPRLMEAEGLLAVCIQHEMDHLLGKVFVEYLSLLKRKRIKTKMLKAQRENHE
jgi:peptide deformylase